MMESAAVKKEKLHRLVDSLSAEQLDEAEAVLERICHKDRTSSSKGRHTVKLGGLWKDLGVEITEEDIAKARREMWGRFRDGE